MKHKSIAFKLIAWIMAIVISLQSIVFITAYFSFDSANKGAYRTDNGSICDTIEQACESDDYFESVFEIQAEDYKSAYPNKPYEELNEEEKAAYTKSFDNLNENYNYPYYVEKFQLMADLAVVDYLTIGIVDETTQQFVGLYLYVNKEDNDVRKVGFYKEIPTPIKECSAAGTKSFDGEIYDYQGVDLFASGRKFETNTNLDIWLILEQKVSSINKDLYTFLFYFILVTFIITLALLVGTITVLYKIGLNPIKKLSNKSEEYADGLKNGVISDSFNELSKKDDEIGRLNNSFYYLDKELRDYVKQIQTATSVAERMKSELNLAKKIQLSTLPDCKLFNPKFSIDAFIRPAKKVGGDLYGFEQVSDDLLYFYIGDVSGKGIPAALFMMQAKTLLQENLFAGDLAGAVKKTNVRLSQENSELLFITAFIGVLNLKTGLLKFINAAHEPLFLSRNGKYQKLEEKADVPLATLEDFNYTVQKIKLHKNDRLFLYTDGVSESMDKNKQLYGKKRIEETLNLIDGETNTEVIDGMINSIDEFAKGVEQSDDICMLSLSYESKNELSISTIDDLEKVNPFVNKILNKHLTKDSISKINVALDELLNNVISYAKLNGKSFSLSLSYDEKNHQAQGCIIDEGLPFDPINSEQSTTKDKVGGYGIQICKNLLDSLTYAREGKLNIVKFTKKGPVSK